MDYNAPLIMMVEDDADITRLNRKWLEEAGYNTLNAETLAEARDILRSELPDVIILDVQLPDGSGVDFFPELRRVCAAPVLFLTAKDKPEDRLAGLVTGGNDYITKPYDIAELCMRVNNFIVMLQSAGRPVEILAYGSLRLDIVSQRAYMTGVDMNLSAKEFALLKVFITNRDKIMDIDYLYKKIWNAQSDVGVGAVKTAVSRLRMKLDDSEFMIVSKRGEGYSFLTQ